ncbi:MAG: 2-dehydropantoate 2-reductase [Verrucomicrobia bacterium]|nr:2-dehydropantoate 2-reductase [Verrucomicrobiota bacterium]
MKRVLFLGSGALALYYGGRMARAGVDVVFWARSDAGALRQKGLRLVYPGDAFHLSAVNVVERVEDAGAVDLVVIALKATANADLPRLLPAALGQDTVVLNLQNGLGVDEAVADIAGAERTLGALCFVGVNRVAPGEAVCAHEGYIVLGEFSGAPTARTEAVAEIFRRGGTKVRIAPSLLSARWHKLIWNVPFNGLSVVERGMLSDEILRDAGREARVRALMRELQTAAAAEGVEIADAFIEDNVERTRSMAYKPSTMLDWLAGRPLELEPIWGEPLRRARRLGVATPELARLYAEIQARAAEGPPLSVS